MRADTDAGLGGSAGHDSGRRDAEPEGRGPAAYVAEFIGTLTLVFFVTMAVSQFVAPPSQTNPNPFIDWSVIGMVHVFVLFMLIQTLALVSGAHFNPAVTAALTLLRQIRPPDAVVYVVCQLAGAIAGVLLTKLLVTQGGDLVNYGSTLVNEDRLDSTFEGFLAEMVGTFFLMWAIVGVAVNPNSRRDWAAFVIGATLGLVVMVIGPLTGAGLNPARSIGPALVSGEWGGAGEFLLVYVLAPVVGAVLAALAYSKLFFLPGKKGTEGMDPVG